MARGGKRAGAPGRSYSNRTDLQRTARKPSVPTVAPAATNPNFGDQATQLRSMQALPASAPAGSPQPSTEPASAAPPLDSGGVNPGGYPPLARPTERPGEPITQGAVSGPGAGPEIFGSPQFTDDPEHLRSLLPGLEALASLPDASNQTRNLVRLLRGSLPSVQ